MQLTQAGGLHSVPGRGVSQKAQQEIPTTVATSWGGLAGLLRGDSSGCTGPSSQNRGPPSRLAVKGRWSLIGRAMRSFGLCWNLKYDLSRGGVAVSEFRRDEGASE